MIHAAAYADRVLPDHLAALTVRLHVKQLRAAQISRQHNVIEADHRIGQGSTVPSRAGEVEIVDLVPATGRA